MILVFKIIYNRIQENEIHEPIEIFEPIEIDEEQQSEVFPFLYQISHIAEAIWGILTEDVLDQNTVLW
jgi:hypothetical protein